MIIKLVILFLSSFYLNAQSGLSLSQINQSKDAQTKLNQFPLYKNVKQKEIISNTVDADYFIVGPGDIFMVDIVTSNLVNQFELIISVTSENISLDVSSNYLTLANNPIESTENVMVSVLIGTEIVPLSDEYYSIDSYQGIIEIASSNYTSYSDFYVTYDYLNAYETYAYIAGNGSTVINSDDFTSFDNIPIKYDGIDYMVWWNRDDNEEVYLEEGTEFTVEYLSDGQTIEITFLIKDSI